MISGVNRTEFAYIDYDNVDISRACSSDVSLFLKVHRLLDLNNKSTSRQIQNR